MSIRKIIIVDDDADDRAFFCEAVSEVDSDIECIGLNDGEEAIRYLEKNPDDIPDYIFLDLNMPRMNGKQCLKRIKSNENLSFIPVVIYSTSKSREDIVETESLGAVCFLTKPNKFSELKLAIKKILAQN